MIPEQGSLHEGNTEGDDFLLFDLSGLSDDELANLQQSTENLGAEFLDNQDLVKPLLRQLDAAYDEKARSQGL